MNNSAGSLIATHGRLWYDDRRYRIAWIVWPQSVGLLLFVWMWLIPSAIPGNVPWAKPAVEAPKPPQTPPIKQIETAAPPLNLPPANLLAPCQNGQFSQIIITCSALLAAGTLNDNNRAYAYWHRGWAYYSLKQYQAAMEDYNRAIATLSSAPEFFNDRGILWMTLDNNQRALQDFNRAVGIKSDYALGHANRGAALRNLKQPDEALAALATAIDRNPSLAYAYETRAFVYEDSSNWNAMFKDASKLIELSPNYRIGYEFRGHAYLEASQFLAAVTDFSKAISIDDSAIYGWRMRGRAYYFLGQYENARSDLNAALRIDPKDSSTIAFVNDLDRRTRK